MAGKRKQIQKKPKTKPAKKAAPQTLRVTRLRGSLKKQEIHWQNLSIYYVITNDLLIPMTFNLTYVDGHQVFNYSPTTNPIPCSIDNPSVDSRDTKLVKNQGQPHYLATASNFNYGAYYDQDMIDPDVYRFVDFDVEANNRGKKTTFWRYKVLKSQFLNNFKCDLTVSKSTANVLPQSYSVAAIINPDLIQQKQKHGKSHHLKHKKGNRI